MSNLWEMASGRVMRLAAVVTCLAWSSAAMAMNIHPTDWINYSFVGGFQDEQIAKLTSWINETCKPDELGNITGFSYTPPNSKFSVTVFCHKGSGKLGKVGVARVKFHSSFAFKMDQLNSLTAIIIGFEFEKADDRRQPIGEAVIVSKECGLIGLLDIRRSRTFVRTVRLINLGFEFGGLLDQARSDIRVRDCPGEFEKRRCLTRQILPAHHCCCLRIIRPADVTLQRGNSFRRCVTK